MPEHIRREPKVLVSTENLTEQEWLAYRRRGIGGSDVAAILGISPFRTARDLYDDKLNIALAVDDAGNWVALEMGHLLEPLVAQIFTFTTSSLETPFSSSSFTSFVKIYFACAYGSPSP